MDEPPLGHLVLTEINFTIHIVVDPGTLERCWYLVDHRPHTGSAYSANSEKSNEIGT